MLNITAKNRTIFGRRKLRELRESGIVPAIIYGPKIKSIPLQVNLNDFEDVYNKVGETSLINLDIEGENKKFVVLIHDVETGPVDGKIIHVDFYQPNLEEKIEADIPIQFINESPAVKDLEGTLVKNIQEIPVKALPRDLPKEIEADISLLKNLNDELLVKDLNIPNNVEVLKDEKEIVAYVAPPENVEEELEKPIEEKVEEVEKVEKPSEEKETSEGKTEGAQGASSSASSPSNETKDNKGK